MGVYRRHDSSTYWMSLVINGKRERQDTGVQDRRVAGDIFAAWQVQVARSEVARPPRPHPAAHGSGPLEGVSQLRSRRGNRPPRNGETTWSWSNS